jgi:hypothetical protein
MSIYKLVCDNGQILQMELNMKPHPAEIEAGWVPPTIEAEIAKLEVLFAQLADDKAQTGQHPSGWLDPLPTVVTSYRQLVPEEKIPVGTRQPADSFDMINAVSRDVEAAMNAVIEKRNAEKKEG